MSLRIAHLSDLHLGFRAYPGEERGWNRRERDVADAFSRALQAAARLRPDLVLLTGDLFDRPDPPSSAFLSLVRGVHGLRSLLPGVPVLAIAGERDTPARAADPGPVAVLDALPGVEAAAGAARAVRFAESGVHALLVPHRSLREPPLPELRPDPTARYNVLLLRGRPLGADGAPEPGGPPRDPEPPDLVGIDPSGWDYVAVGGPHRAVAWGPRVRAAGSLERVGWDPWAEGTEEKGFLLAELDEGSAEMHPVRTRPVVDLAPVRCDPGDPSRGSRRLRHLLEAIPGGVAGRLLRVRLEGDLDLPEEGVDPGLLAGVRRSAAHLEIRIGAEETGPGPGSAGGARPGTETRPRGGGALRFVLASRGSDPWALAEWVDGRLGSAGAGADPGDVRRTLRRGGTVAELLRAAADLLADDATPEASARAPDGPTADAHRPPLVRARASAGREPDADPGELETLERRRREDVVELEGEVEARTFEWARERQDAETRLAAYRERAQELRERIRALDEQDAPCPTCGRVLGDARERLREALRDEWETVVQDGKWWKRRRRQLDDRPEELVALERKARRLRAELADITERLERAPSPRGGGDADPRGEASASRRPGDGSGRPEPVPPRAFLRRAGSILRHLVEGRVSGVRPAHHDTGADGLHVVAPDGPRRPGADESGLLRLSLHLALRGEWLRRGGAPSEPLVLTGLDDRGVDPLLPLLTPFLEAGVAPIVVLPEGAPRPTVPGALEIVVPTDDSAAGAPLRTRPLGPALLRWEGPPDEGARR